MPVASQNSSPPFKYKHDQETLVIPEWNSLREKLLEFSDYDEIKKKNEELLKEVNFY